MASNEITVGVQISGKCVSISVPPDCYVRDLEQRIHDREGINMGSGSECPQCRAVSLVCQGKQLERFRKISDYNIRHGSMLCIAFKALGGGLASVWYENGAMQVGGPRQRQTYSKQIAEFSIATFHVSCKSDKIGNQNMMGLVLYLCDNKQLFYLNGMKCRSGYVLLVNSDKLSNISGGTMHSKAFKYFVGKDLGNMNIVGGGFSIQNGSPVFRSGTFNVSTTKFHDGNKEMHNMEKQCITAAINNWKKGTQNTNVSQLYANGNGACKNQHGFY